jgi:alpha-ribazole phosphatase/probable phosphoglycerate mutase
MSSLNVQHTQIDLLRHGEVQGGVYFRGRTDDPLSERGWQQVFKQCRGKHWDVVISSPLRRCASFAAAWGEAHQLPVEFVEDWMEIDFGAWEGLSAEYIKPEILHQFYADPLSYTPPNAESYSAFTARIEQAWNRLISQHPGKTILVVTHAGVIRALYGHLLHIPPPQRVQIEVPYACLTRFSCFDDEAGRFTQLNFHTTL